MKKVIVISLIVLVILVIVLVIVCLLSTYGISLLGKNSRDAQRKDVLNQIELIVETYYVENAIYPEALEYTTTKIKVEGETNPDYQITVNQTTYGQEITTEKGTLYCYGLDGEGGFLLGARLEVGEWYNSGTSKIMKCEDGIDPGYFSN